MELIKRIKERLNNLDSLTALISKELKNDYFDVVCLGIPNAMTGIIVLLEQLEIKVLELKVQNNHDPASLKEELENLREKFKETARHIGLLD